MNKIVELSTLKEYNNWFNLKPNNFIIIYLYSNLCDTCNNLKSKLDKLVYNNNSNIIFLKIDVENDTELVKYLDITTYPVFRIYKNYVMLEEIFGTYDNIIQILESFISEKSILNLQHIT